MTEQRRFKDYFSFESIRDKDGEVVCYHITMIGTIEEDGVPRIRSDIGTENDKRYAFGKLTVRGCDRKIRVLLNETNSRIYSHTYDPYDGTEDTISFAARDWRADEVYQFNAGDRVLLEGRAYIRYKEDQTDERLPELSLTVTGHFLLGRRRNRVRSMNADLVPQE